jgi:cytochrome c553
MKVKLFLIIFSLLALPGALLAKTKLDAEKIVNQGNAKGATACIACHGQKGEGNAAAGYPYLTGMSGIYLKSQLLAFKQGARQNSVMQPIAGHLTEAEIDALANYYAELPNKKISTHDNKQYTQGKSLAIKGKWQSGMPACFKCHDENGQGIAPHFPPITGQPFQYIKNQLNAFRSGKRNNDPVGLMQAVADKLDQGEIEDLAHYLSAQK